MAGDLHLTNGQGGKGLGPIDLKSALRLSGPLPALALAIGSGWVLWLAFPPHCLWALAWVAFVPLLHVTGQPEVSGKHWLLVLIAAFVFHLLLLDYVRANQAGTTSLWGVTGRLGPLWLVLSLCGVLPWWVAFAVTRQLRRRLKLPAAFAFPVAWTACDYALVFFRPLFGFPVTGVTGLAVTQTPQLPLVQVADLGGEFVVSLLVAAVNGLLADVFLRAVHLDHYRLFAQSRLDGGEDLLQSLFRARVA